MSTYGEYLNAECCESFGQWLGYGDITCEERPHVSGMQYRYTSPRATGQWQPTKKAAKHSYKAALRQRKRCLRMYVVKPEKNSDWCVAVVAYTARDAKRLAFACDSVEWDRFIDIRAYWRDDITIPPDAVDRPTVFDGCEGQEWLCGVWDYHPDFCGDCPRVKEKLCLAEYSY